MTDEELIARLRDDSGDWLTDAALTANPVDASQTPDPVVNAIMAGYDRKPAPDANNGG